MTTADIRNLRRALGLNTTEFGALVGVSGRSVEDWEQGRRKPSGPARKMMEQIKQENIMKNYAILDGDQGIIEVVSGFDAAVEKAKMNKLAHYVRPVDEEETRRSDDVVVDFGNCHAFAVK